MIRLFRAPELPPDVPAMIVTDDRYTAVLVNPLHLDRSAWAREVVNALLAAADTNPRSRLKAVG